MRKIVGIINRVPLAILSKTIRNLTPMSGCMSCMYVQVNEFLRVLESDLARGVSGRTDSLLSQCMYFGLSFSRIGADFRPLITPVFIRVTVNSYQHTLRSAKHR